MNGTTARLRARRRCGVLSVIIALGLVGCGSSSSHSSANSSSLSSANQPVCPAGKPACVSQSPREKVAGPATAADNLISALAKNQPALKAPTLRCPHSTKGFPFRCTLTGFSLIMHKREPVTGSLTVFGVDTATHTYAYSVTYAPAKGA